MRERKVNNEMVGENIEIKMVKKIMGIEVNSIEIDEKEKEKRINEKIDIIRKGNMGKGDQIMLDDRNKRMKRLGGDGISKIF